VKFALSFLVAFLCDAVDYHMYVYMPLWYLHIVVCSLKGDNKVSCE
jgi:hypothetical protein